MEDKTTIILDKSNKQMLEELGFEIKKVKKPSKRKDETRGGARAGAGRKRINEAQLMESISLSVSPQTKAYVKELRNRGINPTRIYEDTIAQMAQMLGL